MVGKNNKLDRLDQELIITNLGEPQIRTGDTPWNAKLYMFPNRDHRLDYCITVIWHKDISIAGWPVKEYGWDNWADWYGWNISDEIEIEHLKGMISPRLDRDTMDHILRTIEKARGQWSR
jgi:hypothetical protein